MSRILYAPSIEKRNRRRPSRKAVFAILAIALFLVSIGGVVYLLRLPQWQVHTIEITGLTVLKEEDVRGKIFDALAGEYLFLIPRGAIILARSETIERALKKEFPRIETVNVNKHYPDSLTANIKERELWGIFCNGLETEGAPTTPQEVTPACVYIDKTGFAYESAPDSTGTLIVKIRSDAPAVAVGSQAVENGLMEKMSFLAKETERVAGTKVIELELFSKIPREIRLVTADGFKLYMNREDDFENVFRVLKTVMDEEIKEKRPRLDYIDLRFGNKVFYKLQRGGSEN